MFNTTLTDEYLKSAHAFNLSVATLEQLSLNAVRASYLPDAEKQKMEAEFQRQRGEHGLPG